MLWAITVHFHSEFLWKFNQITVIKCLEQGLGLNNYAINSYYYYYYYYCCYYYYWVRLTLYGEDKRTWSEHRCECLAIHSIKIFFRTLESCLTLHLYIWIRLLLKSYTWFLLKIPLNHPLRQWSTKLNCSLNWKP